MIERWVERNRTNLIITLFLIILAVWFEGIANAGREVYGWGGEYAHLVIIPFLNWRWLK